MDALIKLDVLCGCAAGCAVIIATCLVARLGKQRERRGAFLAWAMDRIRCEPDDSDFVRRVAASLEEGTYFSCSVWKGV